VWCEAEVGGVTGPDVVHPQFDYNRFSMDDVLVGVGSQN